MPAPAISPHHQAALDHAVAGHWALALAAAQQARAKEANPERRQEIDQLVENSARELRVRLTAQQPSKPSAFRLLTAFWLSATVILVVVGLVLILWTLRSVYFGQNERPFRDCGIDVGSVS